MLTIGLDIGTTTISGVVRDARDGRLLTAIVESNDSALKRSPSWQDCESISEKSIGIYRRLVKKHPKAVAAGITGQMHGILYVNRKGRALTPLYTWQDARGEELFQRGWSYVDFLREKTGHRLASGFGIVTHFIKLQERSVPKEAVRICSIGDYIAMRLANLSCPVTDATHAASFGLFDVRSRQFDVGSMQRIGLDPALLPHVASSFDSIGRTAENLHVFPAVGDNQASFLGAVPGIGVTVLVNVGTGSQVCVYSQDYHETDAADIRPFPTGGYLYVNASLCGGRAYAMLERFFRQVFVAFGNPPPVNLFDTMNKMACRRIKESPRVDPRFCGTREDMAVRGAITGIGVDNFTPEHLCAGFVRGVVDELHSAYERFPNSLRSAVRQCVGSGNGLRLNPAMRNYCSEAFGMPLRIPAHREEAACGAAIIAALGMGVKPSVPAHLNRTRPARGRNTSSPRKVMPKRG
jgi:sedoheptulokinase